MGDRSLSLGELASRLGGAVEGDPELRIEGVASLEDAEPRHLSFWTHPRYRAQAATTRAGAVLVGPGAVLPGRTLLRHEQPYVALARALEWFHPEPPPPPGVHPSAVVHASARIAPDASVGPLAVVEAEVVVEEGAVIHAGAYVGAGARVGAGSTLFPGVVLYPGTWIGRRCRIHSGTVLGADGFGFAATPEGHVKIPQVGRVVVEDDVEIGANSAVDRATLGETRLGAGSKLDDLVMVAHGVRLGAQSLLAGQAGIAGSAHLGRRVTLAGQSGVAGHLHVGDGVVVAAKSAVFRDLEAGAFVAGIPAVDHREWKRVQAALKRLPELHRNIKRLERRAQNRASGAEGEGTTS